MNAEQLHTICKELKTEIEAKNILGLLKSLEQSLQQSVSQPNQPQFQEQIGKTRTELSTILSEIEQQERPITKRQIVDEIGGTNILGGELLKRIEDSFSQLEVTPTLVQTDITKIHTELESFLSAISALITGFNNLSIEADELEEFTAELGIVIPRRNNAEDLAFFSKDIAKLERELQPFNELVTGQAEKFKIRSISSSDFSVFLELLPETTQAIVATIGLLLLGYEKLLDIRLKRSELKKQEAPEAVVSELDKWAESLMADKVNEITTNLMEQFKDVERPDGRVHEVEGHIRLSIKKIAGRLDVGYHFTARIGEVTNEEELDEDSTKEFDRKSHIVKSIKENSSKIDYRDMVGEPVLPLTWQPNGDDEADDSNE